VDFFANFLTYKYEEGLEVLKVELKSITDFFAENKLLKVELRYDFNTKKIFIGVRANDTDGIKNDNMAVEEYNTTQVMKDLTKQLLNKIYRYEGEFEFESDISNFLSRRYK
jgi:hypothetical protein